MKRATGLFDQIHQLENLRIATARAMRGKRARLEVRRFFACGRYLVKIQDDERSYLTH